MSETAYACDWAPARTARKAHRCIHCERQILPGDRYHYARITPWDHRENGGFSDYHTHPRCHEFWMVEGWDRMDGLFWGEPREFRRARWRYHVRRRRAVEPFDDQVVALTQSEDQ